MRFARFCILVLALQVGLTGCLALIDDYKVVCDDDSDCRDGEECVRVSEGYYVCEKEKSGSSQSCPKGSFYDSDPEECVSDIENDSEVFK